MFAWLFGRKKQQESPVENPATPPHGEDKEDDETEDEEEEDENDETDDEYEDDDEEETQKESPPPVVEILFPSTCKAERLISADKQREYEKIAESLGFLPAELVLAQLLEFFENEKIELYYYGEVKAWLTQQRELAKAEFWCWRALRERDIITNYQWGYDLKTKKHFDSFYSGVEKSWECRPYERLIPQHALEKVQKIGAIFGDRVKFFVSDYDSSNPNSFIMVRPARCDSSGREHKLIFDTWKKPGF